MPHTPSCICRPMVLDQYTWRKSQTKIICIGVARNLAMGVQIHVPISNPYGGGGGALRTHRSFVNLWPWAYIGVTHRRITCICVSRNLEMGVDRINVN